MTGALIDALDVSSAQPQDLSALIEQYGPSHIVVKLYSAVEAARYQAWTLAQAKSARDNGCTVGGYIWIYSSPVDPRHTVQSALDLADQAGIALPIAWLDAETYTDGSYPTIDTLEAAADEVQRLGLKPGVYTGGWFWKGHLGNTPRLGDLPLWSSQYDDVASLDNVTLYGGWTRERVGGKQWSGSPVDRSVFRAEFATP